MTAKNEISEELKGLSEVVAGISPVTPYEAPETPWFEGLSDRILERIRMEAPETGLSLPKKLPFGDTPQGYFEGFASKMLDKVRNQTVAAPEDINEPDPAIELAGLSPLLSSIGKQMPYQTPAGFFERISADEELGPVLASIRHRQPFQTPSDYFSTLPENILLRTRAGETLSTAETAAPIRTEELPRIPAYQGAVSVNPEPRAANTEENTPGKVVRMGSRKRWLRFAGIAVAASAILVFGWLTIQTSQVKPSDTESNSDISKNLTKASDQDIEYYIDSQHTLSDELANSTAAVDISANDLTSMLDDVSDAELKEYMEEHGNAKDLPMN